MADVTRGAEGGGGDRDRVSTLRAAAPLRCRCRARIQTCFPPWSRSGSHGQHCGSSIVRNSGASPSPTQLLAPGQLEGQAIGPWQGPSAPSKGAVGGGERSEDPRAAVQLISAIRAGSVKLFVPLEGPFKSGFFWDSPVLLDQNV